MNRWPDLIRNLRSRSYQPLDDLARQEALEEIIRKMEADRQEPLREADKQEPQEERGETHKNHTIYKSPRSDWVSRTKGVRKIMPWVIAGISWGYLQLNVPYMHPWSMIIITVLIGVVLSRFQDFMVHGLWGEGVDIIIDKLDRPKRKQEIADWVKTGEDGEPIPDPIGRAPDRDPREGRD